MMLKGLIFFSTILFAISCSKKDEFNATVQKKGIDCSGAYLLMFDENADGLPANNFENIFYEINLPEEFKVEGIRIKVRFRLPKNEEVMACTTLGTGYPQVFIISAE